MNATTVPSVASSQTPLLEQEMIERADIQEHEIIAKLRFASAYSPSVRLEKLKRIERLAKLMIERFEDKGVQVFLVALTETRHPLDLFVRFPNPTHLLIFIRSTGHTRAIYYQDQEMLRVRRLDKVHPKSK